MKFFQSLALISMTLYVIGCTHVTSNYGASPKNVDLIKSSGVKEISVGEFTSKSGNHTSITCRAAGPVKNKNDLSFEDYIEGALKNELQMAGAYKDDAEVKISGLIDKLDFNSNIGAGKWMINATISSPNSSGYSITSTHEFSTNFVADKACQQVAQAFEPAVEEFINKIISHPKFSSLAK
ncbi:hypothetical protein R50072_36480 [Simiduia litorea]|uniref:hypothetical protein n=1 Tax=Simiduia litorea TaxID=1435348 RepID=UPI0036F2D5EC